MRGKVVLHMSMYPVCAVNASASVCVCVLMHFPGAVVVVAVAVVAVVETLVPGSFNV